MAIDKNPHGSSPLYFVSLCLGSKQERNVGSLFSSDFMESVSYHTDLLVFTPPQGALVVRPMCCAAVAHKQILS